MGLRLDFMGARGGSSRPRSAELPDLCTHYVAPNLLAPLIEDPARCANVVIFSLNISNWSVADVANCHVITRKASAHLLVGPIAHRHALRRIRFLFLRKR